MFIEVTTDAGKKALISADAIQIVEMASSTIPAQRTRIITAGGKELLVKEEYAAVKSCIKEEMDEEIFSFEMPVSVHTEDDEDEESDDDELDCGYDDEDEEEDEEEEDEEEDDDEVSVNVEDDIGR